jgi:hypothetical protein
MPGTLLIIVLATLLVVGACKRSDSSQSPSKNVRPSAEQGETIPPASPAVSPAQQVANSSSPEIKAKTDACALLTSNEIQLVQGEPLKETKLSTRSERGFVVSQCFFTLPTSSNSISLTVTEKAEGAGAKDPKQLWKDTFSDASNDIDREKEAQREGDKEEGKTPRKKITGIGEEAFWTGSRVGGALYVLKGNTYVRISVGGAGDEASKIKKSRALALKAISRL